MTSMAPVFRRNAQTHEQDANLGVFEFAQLPIPAVFSISRTNKNPSEIIASLSRNAGSFACPTSQTEEARLSAPTGIELSSMSS